MKSAKGAAAVLLILLAGCAKPWMMGRDAIDSELAKKFVATHDCREIPEENQKYDDGSGEFTAYSCIGESDLVFIDSKDTVHDDE